MSASNPPISALFPEHRPLRSLEFFPPKDDAGVESLRAAATALRKAPWDFVSVTYGAGGSTRQRTTQVSRILKDELGFTVMPHLTCVGHSRAELTALADQIHADGFRNIMALRGDPPKGSATFTPAADGLRHANELVALLKQRHPDFCLGVAGYPEKHPEAVTLEADLDALKRKIDDGASFVTTQLFFDNAIYQKFVEKCHARGIHVPIIPGIMPVLSIGQIKRIATLSGTQLPPPLARRLEVAAEDPDVVEIIGIDWALDQIRGLLAQGAPGYHLYILNRAKSALALAAGLAA
ncbi:methylenetetrahydrofolate reductase [NAD(P)H] [Opitutaceae bacterium TAV4]|uniref:methylenetetrahydrofolate reductase [NAD(P)H] n=1 Tax=Geminisphaera colitermitum TaxID=1148786 RepID=UPI000158CB35|nr:methylenetetrahydrofolate reductase [NAD(P)H] [Geminisphaera colitermitum]RRJ96550.1 methylenetetrahydrofolate reductase [NAD(P)H] [Opitutaceae bacterium TAV4]RRK00601.1 methylenetetrahydrofolate reductase [NAD(P)H] [Opitutaceae bacterium TAV3]